MESERDSRESLSRSVKLRPSAFTANEIQTVICDSLKTWCTLSSCLSLSNWSPMFRSQPLDFPLRPALCLPLSSPLFPSLPLKAFAWWSDLMVEHAETFLCLYSADMDAALEVQPPDSWDSFPLFQLLNDFLRMDCECRAIKMEKHSAVNERPEVSERAWSVEKGSDTRVSLIDGRLNESESRTISLPRFTTIT